MKRLLMACAVISFGSSVILAAWAHDPFLGLPFRITIDLDTAAISITNTGTGSVAEFATEDRLNRKPTLSVTTAGAAPGVAVTTDGFGTGVEAVARGKGPAANFRIDSPDSAAAALEVSTNGSGPAAKFEGDVLVNGQRVASVPIGAILPYFSDPADLPPGWLPCDGRRVDDQASPLNGQLVPDLRAMFVRGTDNGNALGSVGGRDVTPNHSHWFSTNASTWIPLESGNGYVDAYSPMTNARDRTFDANLRNLTAPDNASNPYKTHGHMNGTTYVGGTTNPGGQGDNRPRFVSLNFIIRVR